MKQGTTQEIAEAAQLRRAVEDILAILASGTPCQGSASSILLASMLDNAKGRIAEIERNIEEQERLERQKSVSELAMAYKAQQEAKLNAEEQRQYAEFLEKEHFTKADFGKLESFYQNTWDRLSEDGKAEMSHRVWEGVRRKEYEFIKLPDAIKEKEAERLYEALHCEAPIHQSLRRVKPQDRSDFLEAWEGNQRDKAFEIMDRPSFVGNVSLKASSEKSKSTKAAIQSDAANIITHTPAAPKSGSMAAADVAGQAELDLADLQLSDARDSRPTPPLPDFKSGVSRTKAP